MSSFEQLPPFGIRGLCSPTKPVSILALSEAQYDSSVQSYPEAALTWLDEDDGEVITVGSGAELRQRLEDPIVQPATLFNVFDQQTQRNEDRYLHLFDISQSRASLAVWREHEAYFSKSQAMPESELVKSSEKSTKEGKGLNDGSRQMSNSVLNPANMPEADKVQPAETVKVQDTNTSLTASELVDCLGTQLGHLADFMQTTSDTLRKAAEKTRETDTSPVEDILKGMTVILGEVGAMGLDVIRQIGEPSKPKSDPAPARAVPGRLTNGYPITTFSQPKALTSESHAVKEPLEVPREMSKLEQQTLREVPSYQSMKIPRYAWTAKRDNISPSMAQHSILDQDAEAIDAEFSARFPPLMSLRRAKTVGALRERSKDVPGRPKMSFALPSDMSRPSPQIFDAETHRRKTFARSCFPGQEYTPGPGVSDHSMPTLSKPVARVTATELTETESSPSQIKPSQLTTSSAPLGVGHAARVVEEPLRTLEDSIAPRPNAFLTEPMYQPLPGAWPEAKADQSMTARSAAGAESSGAFFDRMMKDAGLNAEAPSKNNQRHVRRSGSLAKPSSKPKPIGDLRRAQTVSSTINPAARLNGPFDPIYPAPVTFQTTEEEEPLLPKPTAGPIRSVHRSLSERRPRSFYEPYRSPHGPRDFEPVWEDHLQHKESDSNAGVVFIDASNFEPGTTEQSVRDLLAEDCVNNGGQNALVSCRVVATEPVVLAKLVIKNKVMADNIIAKFDKKMVGGQALRFEYSRSGVDARINRIRGAINCRDTEEGKRVRYRSSVPSFAFAEQGRGGPRDETQKPGFLEFISRSKPVLPSVKDDQQEVAVTKTAPPPRPIPSSSNTKPAAVSCFATSTVPVPRPLPAPISMPPLPSVASLPEDESSHVDLCESALRSMGFGDNDSALEARLKIYAAAANGVIEDAIDMIEQDQEATHGIRLREDEIPGSWVDDADTGVKSDQSEARSYADADNAQEQLDLERAIRLSSWDQFMNQG